MYSDDVFYSKEIAPPTKKRYRRVGKEGYRIRKRKLHLQSTVTKGAMGAVVVALLGMAGKVKTRKIEPRYRCWSDK